MKRSFYEIFGVTHDADQAQIDFAYAQTKAKLNAANLRGVAEAVTEARLARDGYQILSHPEKRARYDAKLLEEETHGKIMFFPDDVFSRRRLGAGTVVLIALCTILGTAVYRNLSSKMDEVRIEHVQAVARNKEEHPTSIMVDATQKQPVVVKAFNEAPKR